MTGRFISPDDLSYIDPDSINGLNLYAYCGNNPVMRTDPNGNAWWEWVLGGLAVAGLVVATVLTCGVAGAGAATVGASMLAGGLISAGINVVDQIHDGGRFDWTKLAISTLAGTAYGLVVGVGGAGAWIGKLAVAGGESLLNSLNENATFDESLQLLGRSLIFSVAAQRLGVVTSKIGPKILSKIAPRNPNHLLTMGDIISCLWSSPAVKTGIVKFFGGIGAAILNDF